MNVTAEQAKIRFTWDGDCFRDSDGEIIGNNGDRRMAGGGRFRLINVVDSLTPFVRRRELLVEIPDREPVRYSHKLEIGGGFILDAVTGDIEEFTREQVELQFTYDASAVCFRGSDGERFSEVGWQNLPGGGGYLLAPVGPTVHHRILHVEIPGLDSIEYLPRCEDRGGFVLDVFTGAITEFDPPA